MREVPITDELFHGHVSIEREDDLVQPWRIPHEKMDLFPPATLHARAKHPAGVKLRFVTDSQTLVLAVAAAGDVSGSNYPRMFDLVIDNEIVATEPIDADSMTVTFANLAATDRPMELWLPQRHDVAIKGLSVDDGAELKPAADDRKKWIAYGSSITHCGRAHSPALTWPGLAARKADLNLTCLGYGGQCHLEPMIARMIRDMPADVITLKLGINVYGSRSIGPRAFKAAAIGLVEIIREKHSEVPIGVISPIYSFERETEENVVGFTLPAMREQLAEAVEALRRHGADNVTYFDGLTLIDSDESLFADKLHPTGDGYVKMGETVYETVLRPLLGLA